MATARANARLALMLAIGDLQKSLGPDKAVTAAAEILTASPAKPHVTGVWESWWDFDPSHSPGYAAEKVTRFRRWLVSNADPLALEARDFATSPWTGNTIELVGNAALGGDAPENAKVTAGKVPVAHNGKVEGAYAWHVADEAAKARINLYRDPGQNATLAQQRALLAGHRPDPSVIKSSAGKTLDCLPTDLTAAEFSRAREKSGKILDLDQVELLDQARGEIKQFRHDLTPWSLGLLTDVRRGGLKEDLSAVFEMGTASAINLPTEFGGKKLYASTHGITGVSDPWWSALAGYYNIFRNITNGETNPTFGQAPKEDVSLDTLAPPTNFHPGPVIAKIETLFNFVVRDSHGYAWPNEPDMKFLGHLVYTPLVTLHNPYNISLSFDILEVVFRNEPVAFQFYVNDKPQNACLIPLCELMNYYRRNGEKSFALKIANWPTPTSTSPAGPIVMKPGQTLVCGPYLEPSATFADELNGTNPTPWFDWDNNLTGVASNGTISAIKARPGFYGRCVGFNTDFLTPTYAVPSLNNGLPLTDPAQSTDENSYVMGLKATDKLHIFFSVHAPSAVPNTRFQVTAKLTTNGTTRNYGGLDFYYKDNTTLQNLLPATCRYPATGDVLASDMYVPKTDPIKAHAQAKTFAIFSAHARTCNGGVYETDKRVETAGAINTLLDGRLAGKPFLFHNPARTVVTMDLSSNKLGTGSHELNFQYLPGSVDDVFEINGDRVNAVTANTNAKGIKSGSYFELPTGPLQTIADFRKSNALTSYYLPNFVQPVGNSSVHPLMSTNMVIQKDASVSDDDMLDHSVLANHALYDRFYFSTFATCGSDTPDTVFEQFMNGAAPLASQAFQPYLPAGTTVADAKAQLFAAGKPTNTAYQKAAQYQMIRGPFNVNSTSVQAWKAVLASMNKSDIVTLWARTSTIETKPAGGVPILGMSLLNGGALGGTVDANKIDDAKANEWNGYRELTNDELENLATNIVKEVRSRGPFLSLSEFVNRQVGAESDLTLCGALEAAIGKSRINDKYFTTQVPITAEDLKDPLLYNYKTPAASCGNPAAGAPGWVSQGDLLRILEPAATVRSDTFVIRVCGEAWDPNGKVTARAYAEAVVQRMPEYVDPADPPSLNAYIDTTAAKANKLFGRRINLVSFRWLSSNEI
jgi:hypothetical protein